MRSMLMAQQPIVVFVTSGTRAGIVKQRSMSVRHDLASMEEHVTITSAITNVAAGLDIKALHAKLKWTNVPMNLVKMVDNAMI